MSDTAIEPNARVVGAETVSIQWLRGGHVEAAFVTPEEARSIRDALNDAYPVEAK